MDRMTYACFGPAITFAILCCSCGSPGPSGPPAGLTCSSTVQASDSASLTSALASAGSGSCVLLGTAAYSGNFAVPAGVTLAGANGAHPTLTATSATSPVVQIAGGAGSGLWNVEVNGAPGVGVAVRDGAATLEGVTVTGAASAAFAALCQGSSCSSAGSAITLTDVSLTSSALGLWVSGATVTMNGGASTDHTTTGLSGGIGVVVQSGGRVELNGVDVERNSGVGFLIDGAGGTTASLQDCTVSFNGDRGIWAQGLTGTTTAPSLTIQGTTSVANNHIAGLGGVDSHGIIFVGGDIEDTQLLPVVTSLGSTAPVGDGVGLFGASGDVSINNVSITGNGRAGALIDAPSNEIIFVGGIVTAGPDSSLLVVVQDAPGSQLVQVPPQELSTSAALLGFSAPTIPVATVLQ